MKISIFPQFAALNSKDVFSAFVSGCKKMNIEVVEHDITADVFAIWSILWNGRMANNQEIWNLAKSLKKPVLVLEVGGLVRGKTWKIGINGINNLANFGNFGNLDPNRPKKLGIFLKPEKTPGENILIFGQHQKSEQWSTRPPHEQWFDNVVSTIRTYSDRKIVLRPHPRDTSWCSKISSKGIEIKLPKKIAGTYDDFDHMTDFASSWAVVNPCSNPGVQAAIEGIPVFTEKDSLAYEVSNKGYEHIVAPTVFDRHDWLVRLCHTEYFLEEVENGVPLQRLLPYIG